MADEKPCTATERVDVSPWVYIGAVPYENQAGSGGGGVGTGVAGATYVWKRSFSLKYSCACGGRTTEVTIPNNVEYYVESRGLTVGGGYLTITLSASLPIPGVLGAIADAFGASIDIAHWFADPAQVDGEKPSDPTPDTPANGVRAKLQPAPVAICGRAIRYADGSTVPWPATSAPPAPPPDTRTQLDCPTIAPTIVTGTSYGFDSGTDKAATEEGALRDAMRSAFSAMERRMGDYKCKGNRCTLVGTKSYGTPSTVVSWPTNASAGDAWISLARVDWVLLLMCQLGGG